MVSTQMHPWCPHIGVFILCTQRYWYVHMVSAQGVSMVRKHRNYVRIPLENARKYSSCSQSTEVTLYAA